VIIDAEAPGLAAEEMERLVTQPMEMALSGMPGVISVRSRSANAVNYVQVLFEWGTDPYRNRQLVTERLALVREQLPAGVIPIMAPMSAATGLIMSTGCCVRGCWQSRVSVRCSRSAVRCAPTASRPIRC
jgi:HME family heavy-metal exporter